MANVMIRCPKTGEAVPTGIAMEPDSWRSTQMSDNRIQCSSCGEVHVWQKEDAFLDS